MPFTEDNTMDFDGRHNTDLGILEFSYKTSNSTNDLSSFDTIAYKGHWEVTDKSLLKSSFSKAIGDGLRERTTITIRIDTVEHRLYFNVN